MRPQSSFPLLQIVLVVALLLLATSDVNQYAQALDPDEYQRVRVVGGAVAQHSTRHLRSGQTRNNRLESNRQYYSTGAEYIRGTRVGKTLHVDLQNERHEATEA